MSFGKPQNYLIWKMGIHFKSENGRFFISSVRMTAWNLIMICQLSSHLMENQDLWIFLFFPMSHLFQLQGTEGFWKIEVFITKRGACLSDTQQKIYANWLEQKREKTFKVPKVFLKGVRKEPRIFQNGRMLLPERKRKLWNAVICLGVTHLILKWYRVNYDLIALGQK